MPPHPANFCIFTRDRILHIGHAGLELLTSSNLPALVFHSAGIIGVSHCIQPNEGSWDGKIILDYTNGPKVSTGTYL